MWQIQVGAISSMVLGRNRYANAYLAMNLSIWHFACKSHVDVKRVYSRFGSILSDTTTRRCLDSLTDGSLSDLRTTVAAGIERGEMVCCIVLDNVQQYCLVREHRLGRQDQLKVGTAATAVFLDDYAPGAFDLQDHLARVEKQARKEMTVHSLYDDIDWRHVRDVQVLHFARALVEFIPQLSHLSKEISVRFRGPLAKKRMRDGRRTTVQPLGTNAEREVETQGMMRACLDFEQQLGLNQESMKNLIFMIRGDGASIAAVQRIKKYMCAHPDDYLAFRNRVTPGPEVWHTIATNLNTLATNHYGPVASADPSALSKSAIAAGVKRPANLSKVDFYPTSRSLTMFWMLRVLDIWRYVFYEIGLVMSSSLNPILTASISRQITSSSILMLLIVTSFLLWMTWSPLRTFLCSVMLHKKLMTRHCRPKSPLSLMLS